MGHKYTATVAERRSRFSKEEKTEAEASGVASKRYIWLRTGNSEVGVRGDPGYLSCGRTYVRPTASRIGHTYFLCLDWQGLWIGEIRTSTYFDDALYFY